jgi:hypothetical protein
MRALALASPLLLWVVTLHAQSTATAKATTLTWGPAPAAFPAGAKMAAAHGASVGASTSLP